MSQRSHETIVLILLVFKQLSLFVCLHLYLVCCLRILHTVLEAELREDLSLSTAFGWIYESRTMRPEFTDPLVHESLKLLIREAMKP